MEQASRLLFFLLTEASQAKPLAGMGWLLTPCLLSLNHRPQFCGRVFKPDASIRRKPDDFRFQMLAQLFTALHFQFYRASEPDDDRALRDVSSGVISMAWQHHVRDPEHDRAGRGFHQWGVE